MFGKSSNGLYVNLDKFTVFKVVRDQLGRYIGCGYKEDNKSVELTNICDSENKCQDELEVLFDGIVMTKGNIVRFLKEQNKDVIEGIYAEVVAYLSRFDFELDLSDFDNYLKSKGKGWSVRGHTTKEMVMVINKAVSEV